MSGCEEKPPLLDTCILILPLSGEKMKERGEGVRVESTVDIDNYSVVYFNCHV